MYNNINFTEMFMDSLGKLSEDSIKRINENIDYKLPKSYLDMIKRILIKL